MYTISRVRPATKSNPDFGTDDMMSPSSFVDPYPCGVPRRCMESFNLGGGGPKSSELTRVLLGKFLPTIFTDLISCLRFISLLWDTEQPTMSHSDTT